MSSTLFPCVEVGPSDASASVLWLHGLGASGHDFEPIVPMFRMPGVRFVFPHAPERPITINGGFVMRAWYDIKSLDFAEAREDREGVLASAALIEALLEREYQRGCTSNKVILAGFSQGGAMALHVGLRHEQTLAGIMALSAYTILADTYPDCIGSANRNTPILFAHGKQDPMVPLVEGKSAYKRICDANSENSRPSEWYEFDMAHEVSLEEVNVIGEWLRSRLAI